MLNQVNVNRIYLAGICGTGMAALAAMLKSRGYEVRGSDENVYPPMSTFLEKSRIPVLQGFDPSHLSPHPDLIIIGNALSRGNPEVEYILNHRLHYTSLPAALYDFFIRDKYACVVTGTHGKTTTTSLLAWILEACGQAPGFFIGGIAENFGQGARAAEGEHFVIEGDEYDSAFFDKGAKFLHYRPDLLIINNVEYDHADIYKNLDEIKTAFRRLVNLVPANGHIIANGEDPMVRRVCERAFTPVHFFGLSGESQWRAADLSSCEEGTSFTIHHRGSAVASIHTILMGEHNVRNVLAAFAAAIQLGLPPAEVAAAISSFKGVHRRMTQIGNVDGVYVFDDFAHHATAVRETLRGARQRFGQRRIWAIFEPRTASAKRKVFESLYYTAFDDADRIVLAPLHRPDKVAAEERLSVEAIVAHLQQRGKSATILPPGEEMLHYLLAEVRPGDVFVFMSNGDFGKMPVKFANALRNNHER